MESERHISKVHSIGVSPAGFGADNPNVVSCPRCGNKTWMTQACIRCDAPVPQLLMAHLRTHSLPPQQEVIEKYEQRIDLYQHYLSLKESFSAFQETYRETAREKCELEAKQRHYFKNFEALYSKLERAEYRVEELEVEVQNLEKDREELDEVKTRLEGQCDEESRQSALIDSQQRIIRSILSGYRKASINYRQRSRLLWMFRVVLILCAVGFYPQSPLVAFLGVPLALATKICTASILGIVGSLFIVIWAPKNYLADKSE